MALYKDGKVYRTLEQQVGYLSEKQNEQEVINEEVSQDIDDLEADVALLPDKTYVDNADNALQNQINGKTTKGEEIVVLEISTTSGTLSDDDFNLLSLNNVIIKYSSYYLVKILSTTTYYRFAGLISSGSHFYLFEIDKSTKAYTITYSKIKVDADGVLNDYSAEIIGKILTVKSDYSSGWETNSPEGNNVKSTSEASGKVLTTNGDGSSSWQTPSGSSVPIITLTGSSGTLTTDELNKLQNQNGIILRNDLYYTLQSVSSTSLRYTSIWQYPVNPKYITCYRISITLSTRAWSITNFDIFEKTTSSKIDSESAASGQVLTANGNGGASWQTPSGTDYSVTITSNTGTLSVDDFNKLSNDNGVLIRNNIRYRKSQEDTVYLYYSLELSNSTSLNSSSFYRIKKSDRSWTTQTLTHGIDGTNIKSTSETSGKVLTTNGNGGASWQTPTVGSVVSGTNDGTNWTSLTIDGTTKNIPSEGGGSQLYRHNITYYKSGSPSNTNNPFYVYLTIYNTSSSQMSISDLKTFLSQTGNISCTGWGTWYSSTTRILFSITYLSASDKIRVQGYQIPSGGSSYEDADVYTNIIDNVIAL